MRAGKSAKARDDRCVGSYFQNTRRAGIVAAARFEVTPRHRRVGKERATCFFPKDMSTMKHHEEVIVAQTNVVRLYRRESGRPHLPKVVAPILPVGPLGCIQRQPPRWRARRRAHPTKGHPQRLIWHRNLFCSLLNPRIPCPLDAKHNLPMA